MGQIKGKSGSNSVQIKVTFDREIWNIIKGTEILGKSDSSKVANICVSWLSEHHILSGMIKKRLGIK